MSEIVKHHAFHEFISFVGVIESRSCFVKWAPPRGFSFKLKLSKIFLWILWKFIEFKHVQKLSNIMSFIQFLSFLGVIEPRSCFEKWSRWRKGWNRQIVVFRWCHGHRWFSQVDFRSKRYEIIAWLQINTQYRPDTILEFFKGP